MFLVQPKKGVCEAPALIALYTYSTLIPLSNLQLGTVGSRITHFYCRCYTLARPCMLRWAGFQEATLSSSSATCGAWAPCCPSGGSTAWKSALAARIAPDYLEAVCCPRSCLLIRTALVLSRQAHDYTEQTSNSSSLPYVNWTPGCCSCGDPEE